MAGRQNARFCDGLATIDSDLRVNGNGLTTWTDSPESRNVGKVWRSTAVAMKSNPPWREAIRRSWHLVSVPWLIACLPSSFFWIARSSGQGSDEVKQSPDSLVQETFGLPVQRTEVATITRRAHFLEGGAEAISIAEARTDGFGRRGKSNWGCGKGSRFLPAFSTPPLAAPAL